MRRSLVGWLLWAGLVGLLASPIVDAYLSETQPRFVVLQIPAWALLGILAGRRLAPTRARPWNPLGLSGLVFFLGSLTFWMIPRSVDSASLSAWVHQMLHADLLAAGLALGWSIPAMPFVLRAAIGIYGASMIFSLGLLYTHYSGLLCGTFTLAQQQQTGQWLCLLSPLIVIVLLATGARALAREQRGAAAGTSQSRLPVLSGHLRVRGVRRTRRACFHGARPRRSPPR